MTYHRLRQARLVLVDQRDDVLSGHVAVVDDREAVAIEVVADVRDRAGWHGRSDRANVEDVVEADVVDVEGSTSDLLMALLAEDVFSNSPTLCHRRSLDFATGCDCNGSSDSSGRA